ncbi:MAG: arylsulfatase [Chitinophagaceae bacterium]
MKNYSLNVLVLLLFAGYPSQAQKAQAAKPNIILILADDLGYGDLGCYGQSKIKTPNLDKLAKSGMRFTQFYAGATVCAPSRAALMTGLHTGHTAVRGNKGMKPEGQFPLPASTVTIAKLLQQGGYNTGAFGKWGLGFPGSGAEPGDMGFKTFFGYNCQTLAHNYYPDHLWNNTQKVLYPGNEENHQAYSADTIQAHAMKFLGAQSITKPFFLFLPFTLPHADLEVPDDSVYQYYVKLFNETSARPRVANPDNKAGGLQPHAAYAAMVSRLDKYVGEIVAAVTKKGMLEHTLIIFSSDNGPHKEGGNDPAFFNSSGGFTGIKRDLYEGGIREPFIVSWKGKVKAGSESEHIAAQWDLFPTFLQLSGRPAFSTIDGISFLPELEGKPQPVHPWLYWEFHESGGKQAVRKGNWKAVRLNVSLLSDSPIELYDLATDKQEKINVAAKYPEVVKEMAALMQQSHVPDSNWPLLPEELKGKK